MTPSKHTAQIAMVNASHEFAIGGKALEHPLTGGSLSSSAGKHELKQVHECAQLQPILGITA